MALDRPAFPLCVPPGRNGTRSPLGFGAALTLVLVGGAALGGGTELHTIQEPGEDSFGWGVAALGDVNQDGTLDFAVGASSADAPGLPGSGSVSVYSGADGTLLYRIRGDGNFQRFGAAIAALDDLDGDGRADFAVGAPNTQGRSQPPGHVSIRSGIDGQEIRRIPGQLGSLRFGDVVVNVGDVTGDGKADIAVGAPGVTGATAGSSRVYSAADGSDVFALAQSGPTNGSNLGSGIAALGDLDGDGVPDFAVAAPASDPKRKNRLHIGEVIVVSGADGSLIRRHAGKRVGDNFGSAVAAVGDQDGDGVTDLAIGAYRVNTVGEVSVWSGRTGRRLAKLRGFLPNGFFGASIAAAGDVDGDGRAEIAVGASGGSSGTVVVFGTRSMRPLFVFQGAPDEIVGDFTATLGDLDGDLLPELLLGGWNGRTAHVVSLDSAPLPLPAALKASLAFQSPSATTGSPTGSYKVRVKGSTITVTFSFKRLPSATSSYTLALESGPGTGTFHTIGYLQVANGKATLKLSSQYLPPGQLGVQTLAELSGRRIELRDGATVVLELTIP